MNELILPVLVTVLGSGAVFGFLQFIISRHDNKDDILKRVESLEEYQKVHYNAILGLQEASKTLLGNSIYKTCTDYLRRGDYIEASELKNLETMYKVYADLNGNSYAADIMEQVRKLKIK